MMMEVTLPMPRNLVEAATRDGRDAWLSSLPATVAMLQDHWSITVGEPFQPGGQTAWVAPVRRRGDELVLKVARSHTPRPSTRPTGSSPGTETARFDSTPPRS